MTDLIKLIPYEQIPLVCLILTMISTALFSMAILVLVYADHRYRQAERYTRRPRTLTSDLRPLTFRR